MPDIKINIITQKQRTIYGLWAKSSDKTIAKDIPQLSHQYYSAAGKEPESVLPYYVLTKDYDPKTGSFQLFIGGELTDASLDSCTLPEAEYGVVTVKPKLAFLWGIAIGQAKQQFYGKWLPASEYQAINMEYEYHTEKSVGKNPEIDLYFAIERT